MASGLEDTAAALCVVAVGGNLAGPGGDLREGLERALTQLPAAGLPILHRSRWWRSAAWPDLSDPPFLNAVALVSTRLPPRAVLDALHAVERSLGREPTGPRNQPRTMDLDLIAYDDLVSDQPGLTLPHPRAADRLFVVGPLAEIAPDWRWPDGRTAAQLAAAATVGRDAHPLSPES